MVVKRISAHTALGLGTGNRQSVKLSHCEFETKIKSEKVSCSGQQVAQRKERKRWQ